MIRNALNRQLLKEQKKKKTKTKTKQNVKTTTATKSLSLDRREWIKVQVLGLPGRAPGWPGALKLRCPPYTRRINSIRQKGSA